MCLGTSLGMEEGGLVAGIALVPTRRVRGLFFIPPTSYTPASVTPQTPGFFSLPHSRAVAIVACSPLGLGLLTAGITLEISCKELGELSFEESC